MTDALRLAFGTLTALRVPAPRVVDRRTGGAAMTLAPLVGLVLGGLAALVGLVADQVGLDPLVCAALGVGSLAVLTRGLHLDGLADTADGLGSGRRGDDPLTVMTRSDIGPFGVVTLVLMLLLQVAALSQSWGAGHAPAALLLAVITSRAALPLVCRRGVDGAKQRGLGATVAGTVGPGALLASLLVSAAVVVAIGAVDDGLGGLARSACGFVVALAAAALLTRHCVRRFGGTTGDVMGAAVETAVTVALLVLAINQT